MQTSVKMQHGVSRAARNRPTRLIGVAAAALLTVSALSGCAAGMITQTADQVPNHDGAHAVEGPVRISNAVLGASESEAGAVAWTAGSAVPLTFWVTNDAYEADTLTSVSTSIGEATLVGDPIVPAQGALEVGGDSAVTAVIDSAAADVRYGFPIDVDFSFANAGKVTMKVTVAHPHEREAARATMDIYPEEHETIWSE